MMKPIPLFLAVMIFVLGAISGRALFPKEFAASPAPTLSDRPARKIIRVKQSGGSEVQVSPNDIAGLLKLVDPQLHFQSSTNLRAALGDLSSSALEDLLAEIESTSKSHPAFHTLRTSLFDHLIARDPFHALDVLFAHGDPHFRTSNLHHVVTMAARLDERAAQSALAQIKNPALKKAAATALKNSDPDPSTADILAALRDDKNVTHRGFHNSYQWMGHHGGTYWNSNANSALSKLAQKDLAAAEGYVAGLESRNERRNALGQIAQALAQSDSDQALAWVRNLDPGDGRDQHFTTVLNTLAYQDPEKAAGLFGEVKNMQSRTNIISAITNGWMQKDPQGGIAWIDSLPASQAKMSAYSQAAQVLGASDPLAAIALLEKTPGTIRRTAMPQIMTQWANQDFEAARDWVTSQTDPVQLENSLGSIIGRWVAEDPIGMADFLQRAATTTPSLNQGGYHNSLAREWATQDGESALAWAESLEPGDARENAFNGVFAQWGQQDPAAAAAHLTRMSDADQRRELSRNLAGQWIHQDPQATRDWLDTLPPEEQIETASSAIWVLAHSQPEAAAEFIEHFVGQGGDEKALSQSSKSIAENWSQFAPEKAANWAAQITVENNQAGAYASISENWVQQDPAATAGWIDSLPVGIPRDRATAALVNRVSQIDPASAFDWADSINDDGQRVNSLQVTLKAWKATDLEAARQAAAGANVTSKQRSELLERLE